MVVCDKLVNTVSSAYTLQLLLRVFWVRVTCLPTPREGRWGRWQRLCHSSLSEPFIYSNASVSAWWPQGDLKVTLQVTKDNRTVHESTSAYHTITRESAWVKVHLTMACLDGPKLSGMNKQEQNRIGWSMDKTHSQQACAQSTWRTCPSTRSMIRRAAVLWYGAPCVACYDVLWRAMTWRTFSSLPLDEWWWWERWWWWWRGGDVVSPTT